MSTKCSVRGSPWKGAEGVDLAPSEARKWRGIIGGVPERAKRGKGRQGVPPLRGVFPAVYFGFL